MSSESPLGSDYASSEQLATHVGLGGGDRDGGEEDGISETAAGKKRSASSGRSRAVSNLTPEQLARKRAHDRDAQRAIRMRTRGHIQTLEDKVSDLESENGELRRRHESILRVLENLLREGMAHDPRLPQNGTDGREPNGQIPPYLYQQICGLMELATVPAAEASTRNDSISSDRTMTGAESGRSRTPQHHQLGSPMSTVSENPNPERERLSLDFVLQDQKMPPPSHIVSSPNSSEASSASYTRRQSQASNYPISPNQAPAMLSQSPVSDRPRAFQVSADAHWEALPRHLPVTCPLDRLYMEWMEEHMRTHQAQGTPMDAVIGPDVPDVTHVVYPQSKRPTHPIAGLLSELLGTYEKIIPLPERLAIFYVLYVWIRWALYPTKHTYSLLPDFIKPTPLALFTPHPIWMDHVPWPATRDIMHANYAAYPNPNWSLPYTKTVSVNWPFEPHETVMDSPAGNGDIVIHPVFAEHLRNLDNWSVGPEFTDQFPDLQGTMRVHAAGTERGSLI